MILSLTITFYICNRGGLTACYVQSISVFELPGGGKDYLKRWVRLNEDSLSFHPLFPRDKDVTRIG